MILLRNLANKCWLVLIHCAIGVSAAKANAWSNDGHAAIAEAAWQALNAPAKAYFGDRADWLIQRERAQKWRRSLDGYSNFAKASVWPDTRRDKSLEQLFAYFNVPVPNELLPWAKPTTQAWHYHNAYLYFAGKQSCQREPNGQLTEIWPALLISYPSSNESQRAVIMAFLVHLLADANQPLHTMTAVNRHCESDAGGNGFCLQRKGMQCVLNLHQLWDRGFGVFERPIKGSLPNTSIQWPHYPIAVAKRQQSLAKTIYDLSENTLPSERYQQWAKGITKAQAEQAAADLTQLLTTLYEQTH